MGEAFIDPGVSWVRIHGIHYFNKKNQRSQDPSGLMTLTQYNNAVFLMT